MNEGSLGRLMGHLHDLKHTKMMIADSYSFGLQVKSDEFLECIMLPFFFLTPEIKKIAVLYGMPVKVL